MAHPQHQRVTHIHTTLVSRRPGGIRITGERELHTLRQRLKGFPEAMQAILQAAHALRRPISEISAHDVEAWATAESAT